MENILNNKVKLTGNINNRDHISVRSKYGDTHFRTADTQSRKYIGLMKAIHLRNYSSLRNNIQFKMEEDHGKFEVQQQQQQKQSKQVKQYKKQLQQKKYEEVSEEQQQQDKLEYQSEDTQQPIKLKRSQLVLPHIFIDIYKQEDKIREQLQARKKQLKQRQKIRKRQQFVRKKQQIARKKQQLVKKRKEEERKRQIQREFEQQIKRQKIQQERLYLLEQKRKQQMKKKQQFSWSKRKRCNGENRSYTTNKSYIVRSSLSHSNRRNGLSSKSQLSYEGSMRNNKQRIKPYNIKNTQKTQQSPDNESVFSGKNKKTIYLDSHQICLPLHLKPTKQQQQSVHTVHRGKRSKRWIQHSPKSKKNNKRQQQFHIKIPNRNSSRSLVRIYTQDLKEDFTEAQYKNYFSGIRQNNQKILERLLLISPSENLKKSNRLNSKEHKQHLALLSKIRKGQYKR